MGSLPFIYKNITLPSCTPSVIYYGVLAAFFQSICALMAIKGFNLIRASAGFIFQLLASVLAFVLQLIFLPHLFRISACIGAFFDPNCNLTSVLSYYPTGKTTQIREK